ncbi:MAG TPA: T9SS type A sorting domain-containing protein [Cytophagaceae bacterium]
MKNRFIVLLTVIFLAPSIGYTQSVTLSPRYVNETNSSTYHSNSRESSDFIYKMDSIVYHKFLGSSKNLTVVFDYNSDGTIKSQKNFEENKLTGSHSYMYSNGKKTQEDFKGKSLDHYLIYQISYAYNSKGQLSTLEMITKDTFGIEKSAVRNIYFYDESGNKVTDIIEEREINAAWTLSGKRDHHYNTKNQIDSSSEAAWYQGKYFIYSYTTYKYEGNKEIEIKYQDMKLDNETEFNPTHKRESNFDINNQPLMAIDYSWDSTTSNWVKESKDEYVSSTVFKMSNTYSLFNSLDDGFDHGLPLRITTSPWEEKNQIYLEPVLDYEMFYSTIDITSFYESATEAISVFPNPAVDWLSLRIPEASGKISVVNALGGVVLEERWEGTSHELSLEDLRPGTYYFTIINKNKTYSDKLMIR